jgi:hypothetical protein
MIEWIYWHFVTITVDYDTSQITTLPHSPFLLDTGPQAPSLPCDASLLTPLSDICLANDYEEVIVTLLLAVYRETVLCARPLEDHDQNFFPTEL